MSPLRPSPPEPTHDRAIAELQAVIVHEDMQEIISQPPAWLLRWGISTILVITAAVLVACYLVRYPEQLTMPMRLTSVAAPVAVAAAQPGQLRLLLPPNALAAPGQALAYLETTTSFAQARRLARQLRALRAQLAAGTRLSPENIPQTADYNQLGGLEEYFIAFQQAQAVALRATPPAAATERLLQALDLLSSHLAGWEQACVLTAPVAGRTSYAAQLREGQPVAAGQTLFFVVPRRAAADIHGELTIAPEYSSKVRAGQLVLVEADGYPAGEVGLVLGRLANLAEMAAPDGTRQATVVLPQGLETDHKCHLPYAPGMQAKANVRVGNPRLLERMVAYFR